MKTHTNTKGRRHDFVKMGGLLSVAMSFIMTAAAFARAESVRFDIAAQPMPAALREFSAQSHMELLYQYEVVASASGNAVIGDLDKKAALEQLLRNTKLEAVFSSDNAATIRLASADADDGGGSGPAPDGNAKHIPAVGAKSSEAVTNLDQVIVTAQRREERLQDVPLSVVVHTAAELERAGIQNLRELSQVTPSVQIPNGGAFANPTIRGISSDVSGPGAQNSVAVYVDGVYQPAQAMSAFDLPDVTNVQILKGPQGTLYGRNASAGAILISTADPSFTPTGRLFASYGSYGDIESKALLSGPLISDKMAGSIAGYYHSNDGYVRNLLADPSSGGYVGSLRSKLVRGKLLITPTDGISIKLAGYYSQREDRAIFGDSVPGGNSIAISVPGAIVATQPYSVAQDPPSAVFITTKGASAELKFDTEIGAITSVSGWTKLNAQYLANADFSSLGLVYYIVNQFERAYTEDLTFSSRKFGDFTFLAGASYSYDDGKFDPLTILNLTELYDRTRTEAESAFAEVTYDLTDRIDLVGGARYSREQKEQYVSFGVRDFPKVDEATWSAVTPRASIKFKITDSLNTYLTYSEGFKSGSYSSFSFTPVRPEKVKAFELGMKGDFEHVLSFSVGAFHYKFTDMQVQSVEAGNVTVQNAGSSKIYGLDLEGSYAATDRLSLSGGLSLLHARFDSFPNAAIIARDPNCPVGYVYCGNITESRDISGTPLERAPDKTAFLSAKYDVPTSYGTFSTQVNGSYNSGFLWTFGDQFKQGPYAVLNAQINWVSVDTHIRLSFWGRNLTNRVYGISHGIGTPAEAVVWSQPRSVGVSADYSF